MTKNTLLAIIILFSVIASSNYLFPAKDNDLIIDFAQCKAQTKNAYFAFGSITYQIVGKSKHGCVMLYGKEIENPRWKGLLTSICVVPFHSNKLSFPMGNMGPDLQQIKDYCARTPGLNKVKNKRHKR